ncbi:hypothetical protein CTA1_4276 [Colletotrichum tanaceti]|uniref:Uncharacterized protein n=1 Tax=Colletotrichum tanaceti TaxID=1306861 RepID=A0A4U6XJ11_9PEZI|nr:hypothetical protein CTA1_4276 [Colletotrichum tanaceti]
MYLTRVLYTSTNITTHAATDAMRAFPLDERTPAADGGNSPSGTRLPSVTLLGARQTTAACRSSELATLAVMSIGIGWRTRRS